MRSQTFQRPELTAAAAAMDIRGFTPHMLRHTSASLALASGADMRVVQTMLGHKSATPTLDLYGHLFGDRLDVVADAMKLTRAVAVSRDAGLVRDARVEERQTAQPNSRLTRPFTAAPTGFEPALPP